MSIFVKPLVSIMCRLKRILFLMKKLQHDDNWQLQCKKRSLRNLINSYEKFYKHSLQKLSSVSIRAT